MTIAFASSRGQSSTSAFQLYAEALDRGARGPTSFTVGSFNVGFEQATMTSQKKFKHIHKVACVCARSARFGEASTTQASA